MSLIQLQLALLDRLVKTHNRAFRDQRSLKDAYSAGLGDIRYFIEAEDRRGNVTRGALERIFLA
ncbi:MAG: hypothetical protein K9M02_08440 [Thiohalocapsa sp.]|nr:hypothetical protein [Thiohalocapsa sp.]